MDLDYEPQGYWPHETIIKPSDDQAARTLAAILPPDNTRNRFEHTPDGVLQAKNHRVARLQARVDRTAGGGPAG
jgi:hypothetical protein